MVFESEGIQRSISIGIVDKQKNYTVSYLFWITRTQLVLAHCDDNMAAKFKIIVLRDLPINRILLRVLVILHR